MSEDLNRNLGRIHALARGAVAFIWLYHGVVPKLIFHHPDELALMTAGGLSPDAARTVLDLTGWAEVVFAVLLLATWRWRWGMLSNLGLMVLASIVVGVNAPRFLVAAFNPVSLNASIVALSLIAFIAQSAQMRPDAVRG